MAMGRCLLKCIFICAMLVLQIVSSCFTTHQSLWFVYNIQYNNFFAVNNWKKEKKLPNLGMPPFLGSGSHECNGQRYRFVVMERYGTDLWKLFLENDRRFPEHTVYKVSWQIVSFKYI